VRRGFFARPVPEVARDLVGCVVRHGDAAGVIVETEAYHDSEPACHAFVGLTPRTEVLFGRPGRAYVYRVPGSKAEFDLEQVQKLLIFNEVEILAVDSQVEKARLAMAREEFRLARRYLAETIGLAKGFGYESMVQSTLLLRDEIDRVLTATSQP